MLLQIVLHTPRWVFALFLLLLWLGARQLVAHDPGLGRVTLMPLAMGALSVLGLVSVFGDSPVALAGWAVAARPLWRWCCGARCPSRPATTPRGAASTSPAARRP